MPTLETSALQIKSKELNWQDIVPPSLGYGEEGFKERLQYLKNIFQTVVEERNRLTELPPHKFRTFVAKKIQEVSEFNHSISQEKIKLLSKNNFNPREIEYLAHSQDTANKLYNYLEDVKTDAREVPNQTTLTVKLSSLALFTSIGTTAFLTAQKLFKIEWCQTAFLETGPGKDPDILVNFNYSLLTVCALVGLVGTMVIKKLSHKSIEAKYHELRQEFELRSLPKNTFSVSFT